MRKSALLLAVALWMVLPFPALAGAGGEEPKYQDKTLADWLTQARDENAGNRNNAISALYDWAYARPRKEAQTAIAAALKDTNPSVRANAVNRVSYL
ncbi:MAG: hypothetical protein QF662_08645, partial [Phycisphaerae bacterium]|nr:hypothetical protein [Phycisphaerae bacterium]